MYRIAAALFLAWTLTGCLMVSTAVHSPPAGLNSPGPEPVPAPLIRTTLSYRYDVALSEATIARGTADKPVYWEKSLNRVRPNYPYLRDAISGSGPDARAPDYVLNVDIIWKETGRSNLIMSNATFGLLPGFAKVETTAEAALIDMKTQTAVATGHAKRQIDMTTHILLMFALPYYIVHSENWEAFSDELMKDALNQVSNGYKDHLIRNPPAQATTTAPAIPATAP